MVFSRSCLSTLLALSLLALLGCSSGDSPAPETTANINGGEAASVTAGPSGKAAPPKEQVFPVVRIETSHGNISVELDLAKAPLTVENFLSYVENGHYEGTVFHQAVEGYMILGGGFTADLSEKPAHTAIRNEAHNGLSNRRGTIAMARQFDTIDSSTCQFFINLGDNTHLDHKDRTAADYGYCVFGHVTEGQDVADKIGKVPVRDEQDFTMTPVQAVVIKSVKRIR